MTPLAMDAAERCGDRMSLGYLVFLIYLALFFVKPFELFDFMADARPMLYVTAAVWLAAAVVAFKRRAFSSPRADAVLLCLFVLCIGLSRVAAGWAGSSVSAILNFLPAALLYFFVCAFVSDEKKLVQVGTVILLSVLFVCMLGIAAYHQGWGAQEFLFRQPKTDERPAFIPQFPLEDVGQMYMWRVRGLGFMNDPNDFAQTIVMCLPWLAFFYRKGARVRNALFVYLPAAVMLYTVLLTNSRGALVALGLMVLFGLRKALGVVPTVSALVLGVLVASVSSFTGGREFSATEESAAGRIEAWYQGFQMLKSSPVFGVGYDMFTDHNRLTAHNSFVLCFAELGLVGYFFWLALIVRGFQTANRLADEPQPPANARLSLISSALRASLIGFLACAWFLSRTYQPSLFILLAFCACCAHLSAPALSSLAPDVPAIPHKNSHVTADLSAIPVSPWFRTTLVAMFLSFCAVYAFVVAQRVANG